MKFTAVLLLLWVIAASGCKSLPPDLEPMVEERDRARATFEAATNRYEAVMTQAPNNAVVPVPAVIQARMYQEDRRRGEIEVMLMLFVTLVLLTLVTLVILAVRLRQGPPTLDE